MNRNGAWAVKLRALDKIDLKILDVLQENGRAFPPNFLHQSWHDWLYWDIELLA